jgi:uncharacterized protein (TIRG00374 family)
MGLSMSITPGKMGELLKTYLIKKRTGIQISHSASSVFVDRLTDLFAMLLLTSLGVSFFSVGYVPFAIMLSLLLGGMFLLRSQTLFFRFIGAVTKIKSFSKFREPALSLYCSLYELSDWKRMMWATMVSTLAWLMECVSLYVLVRALHLPLDWIHDVFLFSFGTLAGALSMLPGGLGIAEGSMTGLFLYFGIAKPTAVSVTLLIRIVTLWLGVWIGLFVFTRKKKQYLQ